MPTPDFEEDGLLPPGIHTATVEELEEKFGFSARRQQLLRIDFRAVLHELRELGVRALYVDGSFTTLESDPEDIDGFVSIKHIDSIVGDALRRRTQVWRNRFRVDLHIAYLDVSGSLEYYQTLYGNTEDEPPKAKGIVKLILGGRANVSN